MKLDDLMETTFDEAKVNLFRKGWQENAERQAVSQGPDKVGRMWANHRFAPQMAQHMKNHIQELGPEARKALAVLLDRINP